MKKFIGILLAFAMLLIVAPLVLLAQTIVDTSQIAVDPGGVLGIGYAGLMSVVIALYEITVRLWPTTANISILSLAIKIIRFLIPNNKAGGGQHNSYPKSLFGTDEPATIKGPR